MSHSLTATILTHSVPVRFSFLQNSGLNPESMKILSGENLKHFVRKMVNVMPQPAFSAAVNNQPVGVGLDGNPAICNFEVFSDIL